jgi:thymidine phosphorylase
MTLLPQEIIARKRDGLALSGADIARFISAFDSGGVSIEQIAAFAMAVYLRGMSREEAVALTLAMRDSGDVLDWSELDGPVADKHSTGGIGDNVSLMLAPILAACGIFVPMISGRGLGYLGGTLDKLESIPGYDIKPSEAQFRAVTKSVGCAIIGQTANLAPADKTLYAIRDVTATVESIPLITGSILSKKLAAGLGALVLDVKTGSGAFMQTSERSRELAQSLVSVANGAGLRTAAVITDMNEPLASAAGNAIEIRNAVDFLTGTLQDARLREVTLTICTQLVLMTKREHNHVEARQRVEAVLASGAALEKFAQMVTGLGGPSDFIERMDRYLPAAHVVRDVFLAGEGVVSAINTGEIGWSVVGLGGGRTKPTDGIDHAVGFDRLLGLGARVDAHTPIARIHANDAAKADAAEARLQAAYSLGDAAPTHPLIVDQILA